MNNKGLIVLCIMAIVARVGWLAALAGREMIEDMTKEIKFLRSENARLESLLKASEGRCLSYINGASKEPSTIEAVAALAAKCRRQGETMCPEDCNDPALQRFCMMCMTTTPENAHRHIDGARRNLQPVEVGESIEAKTKEYMEATK